MKKKTPSKHAVENAVGRMERSGKGGVIKTKYSNCGRRFGEDGNKYKLSPKAQSRRPLLSSL